MSSEEYAVATLEEISDFFKSPSYNGEALITQLYHWQDPEEPDLSLGMLKSDKLYLCDDSACWYSPHIVGQRLYLVTVVLRNPLLLLKQWESGEHIQLESATSLRKLKKQKPIDAVLVTPHPWSDEQELRELKLIDARKSIIDIKYLDNVPIKPSRRKP